MTENHHKWRIGELPPIIQPHSLAKHRVVERYLSIYVDVLTSDLKIPAFRCTLVDGFAGGGIYRDWQTNEQRLGSPLLMLTAMRNAAAVAQAKRSKPFGMDVEFFFIEEHGDHFPFLAQTIQQSEFAPMVPDKIKLIQGTFLENVTSIAAHIRKRGKKRRAIFLLDQFGYSAIPSLGIVTEGCRGRYRAVRETGGRGLQGASNTHARAIQPWPSRKSRRGPGEGRVLCEHDSRRRAMAVGLADVLQERSKN
jgi:hypothetical protein